MNFHFFISNLVEPISYGLCFLSLLFLVRVANKVKWKVLIAYYFVATLLMVKAAYVVPNIEIYSLLSLLTFASLGFYFYSTFFSSWKKWVTAFFCLLAAGYYITYNFIFTRPQVFDSTAFVILSVGIVLMAFMYMHQLLTNVTEDPLLLNFDFWFVSAQLIYYLGSFFIFLTYGYLTQKILSSNLYSYENRIYLSQLWRVHNVLLFLTSLITSVGIVWISFLRKSRSL